MSKSRKRKTIDDWFGKKIEPGSSHDVKLTVSESYSGMDVQIPIHIQRAKKPGPVVFVTAALHGDEINGTGAIRSLIQDEEFVLRKGAIILVPVLNLLGFERMSRYLPDRRDLNRSFPGTKKGSLASRMARIIFDEIVSRSDYGIDLHTAAVRRTNYPNVRGDLSNPVIREMAMAFGTELIIDGKGPVGAFRREACKVGCPTIIMEGGEVWKVEPGIVESATRGIKNVLRHLDMLDGKSEHPAYQLVIEQTRWIRAEHGGFLQFHIKPGDIIRKGQALATNTSLLGREHQSLRSPFDAVVIGMTSIPSISPGEPVCHVGKLPAGLKPEQLLKKRTKEDGLEQRLSEDLSSNVLVVQPSDREK